MSEWSGDRRGFSLLEAVVALAVVGVAAVAMLASLGAELRADGRVRHALESHALAEARLASLRLLTRSELQPLADSLRRGRFPPPFSSYGWEGSSREVAGRPDVFEVTVAVRWDDGEYDLATRLFRPKPLGSAR
jgi:prepilin-type N-terminal cleavage/methylation domain-containing protein